jgi:hypothetical protein
LYLVNVFMVLPSGPMICTMWPVALTMGPGDREVHPDHARLPVAQLTVDLALVGLGFLGSRRLSISRRWRGEARQAP